MVKDVKTHSSSLASYFSSPFLISPFSTTLDNWQQNCMVVNHANDDILSLKKAPPFSKGSLPFRKPWNSRLPPTHLSLLQITDAQVPNGGRRCQTCTSRRLEIGPAAASYFPRALGPISQLQTFHLAHSMADKNEETNLLKF